MLVCAAYGGTLLPLVCAEAAEIDVGIFDKYSAYIAPSIFYLVYILYFMNELIAGTRKMKVFAIVMLAWLIASDWWGDSYYWLPSLYYDIPFV